MDAFSCFHGDRCESKKTWPVHSGTPSGFPSNAMLSPFRCRGEQASREQGKSQNSAVSCTTVTQLYPVHTAKNCDKKHYFNNEQSLTPIEDWLSSDLFS